MKKIFSIFVGLSIVFYPKFIFAHSFGNLYNLPVPFWMYLYGGAASMVVSFLFIGYFFNKKNHEQKDNKVDLSKFNFFHKLTSPLFVKILKVFAFCLFILTIISGLVGENSSYSNFNMTFFWVVFVLGLTYLTAIVGNVYSFLNPWRFITGLFIDKEEKPVFKYQESWGYYPALVFYFIFIWLELIGETNPLKLSIILIIYTVINDLGAVAFGREIWFKYCEFFSVFFRLLGKIAPFEYVDGKLFLRLPFVGLLKEKAENFSLLLFTLFMLSSTAFDGFRETVYFSRFYWKYIDKFLRPIFDTSSYAVFETASLLLSLAVFLVIYLLLIWLSKMIAKSSISFEDLSLNFVFSLIPIAFVYNIAHYYTIIFTEGPNIVRLILDPFGFGWNFFHIENYPESIVVGANIVWHSQVAFILVGHIVSVYLTHIVALNVFSSSKRTFLSQVPMLVLMVVYTMIGLWVLSQPITGGTI